MSQFNSSKTVERVRTPDKTDAEIIELLRKHGVPMKFQEIAVALNYTSGKLQTAIKRMVKQEKITVKKIPTADGRSEITKIFIANFQTEIVIPIRLDETTAKIISKVPEVSEGKYPSLEDLVKTALIRFFKENIDSKTKIRAIEKAVADGLLSKQEGDELLGR
jgi:DNA-binding Lrp family transcriptional regulator